MICLILGRLFKLHPSFIEMLAILLLQIQVEHSQQQEEESRIIIILFAEKIYEQNQYFYRLLIDTIIIQLRQQYNDNNNNNDDDDSIHSFAEEIVHNHIRIVDYQQYYFQLLSSYTVLVLDTFPYGGKIYSYSYSYLMLTMILLLLLLIGCISTHDAFYYGIPVITYPSEFIR
jgi:hypothetical protein